MKKAMVWIVGVLMVLSLTACGGKTTAEHTMGMSSVASRTMHAAERSTVKVTAAAVVLDEEGVIRRCVVDELEFDVTPTGSPADLSTKMERGDTYIPTEQETGGVTTTASWEQQAKLFCTYVVGKTAGEVSGIAATDGKTTAIEGCDLIVTDLIRAVRAAAAAATDQKVGEGDTLKFAMTAARDAAASSPQFEVELAAVTMDGDTVTGCMVDTLPVSLPTEDGVFTYVSGELMTKTQQGDAYGMKQASSIEREWYEQAQAFATYAVNKTVSALNGISLDSDGKTDAVAGCTISLTAMRQNLLRAINKQ